MNVMKIVNWLIVRHYYDQDELSTSQFTTTQLMDLLYYVQEIYLGTYHRRAFPDHLIAQRSGIVIPIVQKELKTNHSFEAPLSYTEN